MVKGDYYTKTMQFDDINYKLASQEEQETIYAKYCNFLNHFEHDVDIQFSFQNKIIDIKEFSQYIELAKRNDQRQFSDIRHEYEEMLHDQLEKAATALSKLNI